MSSITALLLVSFFVSGCSGCGDVCVKCAYSSGYCTRCSDGYWIHNGKCEHCPDYCEQCSDDHNCSKCKTNFWGTDTCSKQCPESCDDSGCKDENGHCYKCLPGFYNRNCSQTCTLCKDGLCDRSDGQCIDGCINAYYVDTASAVKTCRKCHKNCKLCKSQGVCLECDNGFYKFSYRYLTGDPVAVCYACQPECEECDIVENCTICKPGSYGPLCKSYCTDSNCHRCNNVDNVEKCTECVTGLNLVDTSCVPEMTCSQNCIDVCDENGLCLGDCADGWSGQMCTTQCATQCQKCQQDNETVCTQCEEDFFTSACDQPCIEHCSRLSNKETCRLLDGFCHNGCTDGHWGDTCNNSCNTGCNSTRCSQTDGYCESCQRNYFRPNCQGKCNELCVDDGSMLQICRKSDGRCVLGCIDGYDGDTCEYATDSRENKRNISDKTDSQPSPQDGSETKFYLLGLVTGVGICLIATAGIGLFCHLRKKRKFNSKGNTALQNKDQGREYENTAVGMKVMSSLEADDPNESQGNEQNHLEAVSNVYEKLQDKTPYGEQHYSELDRPKL